VLARRFRPERLTLGVGLVALGVGALLANHGRLDLIEAVRFGWPLLLVLWGVLELALTLASRRAP
jgi:hypothetical protein